MLTLSFPAMTLGWGQNHPCKALRRQWLGTVGPESGTGYVFSVGSYLRSAIPHLQFWKFQHSESLHFVTNLATTTDLNWTHLTAKFDLGWHLAIYSPYRSHFTLIFIHFPEELFTCFDGRVLPQAPLCMLNKTEHATYYRPKAETFQKSKCMWLKVFNTGCGYTLQNSHLLKEWWVASTFKWKEETANVDFFFFNFQTLTEGKKTGLLKYLWVVLEEQSVKPTSHLRSFRFKNLSLCYPFSHLSFLLREHEWGGRVTILFYFYLLLKYIWFTMLY